MKTDLQKVVLTILWTRMKNVYANISQYLTRKTIWKVLWIICGIKSRQASVRLCRSVRNCFIILSTLMLKIQIGLVCSGMTAILKTILISDLSNRDNHRRLAGWVHGSWMRVGRCRCVNSRFKRHCRHHARPPRQIRPAPRCQVWDSVICLYYLLVLALILAGILCSKSV